MTYQQWQTIEQSLAGLSVDEKREVADRILQSIHAQGRTVQRSHQQRAALSRLCQTVEAMPVGGHSDCLTNRDHDRLIYTR